MSLVKLLQTNIQSIKYLAGVVFVICLRDLPDEGGVDFRELGTTSPKLEDEFAPSLLRRGKINVRSTT